MIGRSAKETLLRLCAQFPVVGITGPRQSGKTTLAISSFPDKQYLSFDDKAMRELASAGPVDFLTAFPDGAIIDEAQKVPEIFDALKLLTDRNQWEPGKFILTGSSQFRLRKNMSDSMAGRAAFLNLLPFSIPELTDAGLRGEDAYRLIHQGMYPPLHDPERHFIPYDWFEGYIDTYLERDVLELINPANLSLFRKFLQICAVQSGQLLSMESIAGSVGVSNPTIKSWLSILESSYIIHFLAPDSNNLGKAVVKTPKLYFVDSGLLCHLLRLETKEDLLLSRHKGAVVETFAVSEMIKQRMNQGRKPNLTFFRDHHGFEVDTIADWQHTFAIEVKSAIEAEKKLSGNTRRYLELRKDEPVQSAVFYLGDVTMKIHDTRYVSWKDWGSHS